MAEAPQVEALQWRNLLGWEWPHWAFVKTGADSLESLQKVVTEVDFARYLSGSPGKTNLILGARR